MRFSSAAAWGWKWEAVSSWKLLTSSTRQVRRLLPVQEGDHGGADIAAHQGFFARGGEQLPQQGGGGGLAVGAAHRQERPPDEGGGHFELAHHRAGPRPGPP